MNEKQDYSRRRKAEIEQRLKTQSQEHIKNWLLHNFNDCKDDAKLKAVHKCAEDLSKDIQDKVFDIGGFYKSLENYQDIFTAQERIKVIYDAENLLRDAIQIEELRSKERQYEAEKECIASAGFIENEFYLISFPDKPGIESQKWFVTEFGVYGEGIPHPVRGCPMKKDGKPYRKAQYISLHRDESYIIERVM